MMLQAGVALKLQHHHSWKGTHCWLHQLFLDLLLSSQNRHRLCSVCNFPFYLWPLSAHVKGMSV